MNLMFPPNPARFGSASPRWRIRPSHHCLAWLALGSGIVLLAGSLRVSPAAAQAAVGELDSTANAEHGSPQTEATPDGAEYAAAADSKPVVELQARSSVQTLWGRDKVIVGGTLLRVGRGWFFGAIETHLMWTTVRPDAIERPFLGSQYGVYFEFVPVRTRFVELSTGIGADIFHLWGIHKDEVQASLSVKAQAHLHLTQRWAITLGARAYPVSTSGVALGRGRDGGRSIPILMSTGVEWTW